MKALPKAYNWEQRVKTVREALENLAHDIAQNPDDLPSLVLLEACIEDLEHFEKEYSND